MERDPSQPTECVRPGPEPALDLHLGSECEPQQPMPLVKELLGLGMGGTQHNHCNLMDQKRPWGKNPAQTESKLLGRAPLCQGPLRKRLLPSPGSSCVWKCPHSEQAGQDTGTGSTCLSLSHLLGGMVSGWGGSPAGPREQQDWSKQDREERSAYLHLALRPASQDPSCRSYHQGHQPSQNP